MSPPVSSCSLTRGFSINMVSLPSYCPASGYEHDLLLPERLTHGPARRSPWSTDRWTGLTRGKHPLSQVDGLWEILACRGFEKEVQNMQCKRSSADDWLENRFQFFITVHPPAPFGELSVPLPGSPVSAWQPLDSLTVCTDGMMC